MLVFGYRFEYKLGFSRDLQNTQPKTQTIKKNENPIPGCICLEEDRSVNFSEKSMGPWVVWLYFPMKKSMDEVGKSIS